MEKFNRTLRGYDPEEVNKFLDQVIMKVERMVHELEEKEETIQEQKERILELEKNNQSVVSLQEKLEQYEKMENTLNRAIIMAEKTSDQIKTNAYQESEMILDNAKKNATRIVNEALLRAEKTEFEANMLRRNVNIFKRRLKDIIESQLEIVNDIDKVDF